MHSPLNLFAVAPRGVADLLVAELQKLGATECRDAGAGVVFRGDITVAYRACLWSRFASRILLQLAQFEAQDADALYAGAHAIAWESHLNSTATLAVHATQQHGALTHTQFIAQRIKDAVVDRLRERTGVRPDVRLERPDLSLHVHFKRSQVTVSIDLAGEGLHRRGYRTEGGGAPLKENLAAAILARAGWPALATQGGALVDPLCGSGTLLIEAALMAGDRAPGLGRDFFGFLGWLQHDDTLWKGLRAAAQQRWEAGRRRIPRLYGFDSDGAAVAMAQANAQRAGVGEYIAVTRRDLAELTRPAQITATGLVVTNPPYGERMGEQETLGALYRQLGQRLRDQFSGWRAAVFTGNPELGKHMGIKARRINKLFNGALECQLLHFEIEPRWYVDRPPPGTVPSAADGNPDSPGARMFANRLTKNRKALSRWARDNGVNCYRLYDADMPEYNLAVDLYQGERGRWVHVQEYEAPESVPERKAQARLAEALSVLPAVLEVTPEAVHLKVRRRQRGKAQYEKQAAQREFHTVIEGGLRFSVNFTDYLDTGLFLDHRPTRALLRKLAQGRRFLNLFCYTGTATVYAAAGGARSTTSVDLSRTYLDWARRNLSLNGMTGDQHSLIQADCREWLIAQAGESGQRYGLIFLDPPTFSTSKRMEGTFDTQRDHAELIRNAVSLLEPGGVLLFSTNFRRFKLDESALGDLSIEEISRQTLPRDFARNPRVHRCWKIVRA